jgi:hypothetical protein
MFAVEKMTHVLEVPLAKTLQANPHVARPLAPLLAESWTSLMLLENLLVPI